MSDTLNQAGKRLNLSLSAADERGADMAEHGRMRRIILHWTGGAGRASQKDREHYHRMTESDGKIVSGTHELADNIVTSDGDYAAHTLRLNTGSIGVALCGMRDATERPFSPGPAPINEAQFLACCKMMADLCVEHGIPVTPETVLTHAEVEGTLGVKQRGKWDIARLPWAPELRSPRSVGDYMRRIVASHLGMIEVPQSNRPVLRFGDKGAAVAELQADLASLGYFSGRLDGDFGALTRAALLAFQADQGLGTDAVAGPMVWAALSAAEPRPPRDIAQAEIDATSGTAADARMGERAGDILGIGGAAAMAAQVREVSGAVDEAAGVLDHLGAAVGDNLPLAALVVTCLVAWLALRALGYSTRKRRLRDAQEHRSLSR